MEGLAGASTFRTRAEAYDRHIGRYTRELAERLIERVGVAPGQRVLDVGCGPGAVTAALAAVVGADRVAAVDPSEPFVEACRTRVPGADVRVAPAEELPFGDDTFDGVISQLVLNFMTDAPRGVRGMGRVAKPGGVVASAVWDYAEGMTLLRRFWDAALAIDPAGAAEHDEGRVMPFCSPGELEDLWTQAGLRDVETGELHAGARYDSLEDLWSPFESGVAPSGAYAVALGPERRTALRRRLHELLGAPEGEFTLTARAWYVVGRA